MITLHVPLKSPSQNPKKPFNIRKLLKAKRVLYHQSRSDTSLKQAYANVSKQYDKAVLLWADKVETSLCEDRNPAKFYSYANRKLKTRFSIPPLKVDGENLVISDEEKANVLNSTFHSVFKMDDGISLNLTCKVPQSNHMNDIDVTISDTAKSVRLVPDKLSRTPDGIPAYFLKRVAPSMLVVLTHLFNLTFSKEAIPFQWRCAIVSPIYKKGSRDISSNYRPVSLTCVLCRVLEHIIVEKLHAHLYTNNLLSSNQFGFLPGKSSCPQLLCVLSDWFKNHDANNTIEVIYTDIAKAFDNVSHPKLISVLISFGIQCNVLQWIKSFLADRFQWVSINGVCSSPLPVVSGVPQGSVLGPLLFIIFIDDLVKISNKSNQKSHSTDTYLYADDAKLFGTNTYDVQQALDNLGHWLSSRQLSLSPAKCLHLPVSRNNNLNKSVFSIGSHTISTVNTAVDLGVTHSWNLKWSYHINRLFSIASLCSYHILHSL